MSNDLNTEDGAAKGVDFDAIQDGLALGENVPDGEAPNA